MKILQRDRKSIWDKISQFLGNRCKIGQDKMLSKDKTSHGWAGSGHSGQWT